MRALKHIWLRIELPKYDRKTSIEPETSAEKRRNNQIVTKALYDLLQVLSCFVGKSKEITLELNAHSPSDLEYYLDDQFCPGRKVYSRLDDDICTYEELSAYYKAQKRRYFRSHDMYAGLTEAQRRWRVERSLGIDFNGIKNSMNVYLLPPVRVIKKLLIRRQYTCSFSPNFLFRVVNPSCLFELEELHLETDSWDTLWDLQHYLDRPVRTLRTLTIFGESKPYLRWDLFALAGFISRNGMLKPSLLERLSLAFIIDARDFLQDSGPSSRNGLAITRQENNDELRHEVKDKITTWPHLKYLALTSRILRPDSMPGEIDDLLLAAANAAARMPSLESLEIWNCGFDPDYIFVFQYFRRSTAAGDRSHITARNNWAYRLSPLMIQRWNEVANELEGRDVVVQQEDIDLEKGKEDVRFDSVGEVVMRYLELGRLVLHPVSACREMWEVEMNGSKN